MYRIKLVQKDFKNLFIKALFLIYVFLNPFNGNAQEIKNAYYVDSSFFNNKGGLREIRFQRPFSFLDHSPDKQDKTNTKKYRILITQKPTFKNHVRYHQLARSLWEMNRLNEA